MTEDGGICPPECDFQLKNHKEKIGKLEDEMKERPRTRTLVWIFGPIVTLMLFFVGWSFGSLKDTQKIAVMTIEKHQQIQMDVIKCNQQKIQSKLDRVHEHQVEVMTTLRLKDDATKERANPPDHE